MNMPLPQYLARPQHAGETFGSLTKESTKHGTFWVIKGDPQVAVMAKRLFPGAAGRGAGEAKFPANRRIFADLVWFLQRWPLHIESAAEFDVDYKDTCEYVTRRQALNANPIATAPDVVFKGTLKPFQQEGLSWALTNRRTLIADEMGLGKTVQALSFLATDQAWPALVVVPPHLVRHWEDKIPAFLETSTDDAGPLFAQDKITVHVIRGTKNEKLPAAHIYVIHYLLLRAWRARLRELGIKRIVFDEIQDLRHSGTEKYSAASELASLADDVIGLSGTPIYNYGGEIWNVLNIIEYHCLGDWDSFTREWCNGYGKETVKDPEVLGTHLRREGLMLRRKKEDVLADLPPKRRIVERIDADDGMFNRLVEKAVSLAKEAEQLKDALARGRAEREAITETRRATGVAKAHAAAAFVRTLVEAEEPTLVFAHHHAVVDVLLEQLAEFHPVCISGRENEKEKWEAKEAFRTGRSNICIISLRSATGIDGLQERARVVVFAELDWSPAVHSQAEDRAHRDGQLDSVLCYYLVSDHGTDPEMQEALGLKVSQFISLMGDEAESEEDQALSIQASNQHMRKVLEKLRSH
ncbi:DEAD/DEAH box helicase [Chromobacterium haemolyticum]|uniref:DEAD/DEAH box helicase n=1 Tax=Chromobacterium haemolyticum TaxID=394935 RepID=UPI00244B587E|nr:DEAD/DEAH box helicase [Chromobacterium haemolyticum]MDH0342083.1 DEAD/DEAH box helicase [Chromobacterium haemolyticum]